jgi:hypothetical protein
MGKLKKSNPTKFYVAKFFFLGLALLQWLVAFVLFLNFPHTPRANAVSFLFLCTGSLFMVLFFYLQNKIRRVAIGKKKIVVFEGKRKMQVEWPEVKSIRLVPVFNIYKLEIKNEPTVYFFPSKNVEPAYDLLASDTTKMGEIVSKRKREFGI